MNDMVEPVRYIVGKIIQNKTAKKMHTWTVMKHSWFVIEFSK